MTILKDGVQYLQLLLIDGSSVVLFTTERKEKH